MLAVIDLDVISKLKEMKKSSTYSALRKNSTIMLIGDNVSKNEIDNLKITYDYFYRKDKNLVLKKKQIICDATTIQTAIKNVKEYEQTLDEEIFILARDLKLEEQNNYQIFDLEDQFTDFYDSKNEIDAFVKKMIYQK